MASPTTPKGFIDAANIDWEKFQDGHSADDLVRNCMNHGYTYDDLIVLPGKIDFAVEDVRLTCACAHTKH